MDLFCFVLFLCFSLERDYLFLRLNQAFSILIGTFVYWLLKSVYIINTIKIHKNSSCTKKQLAAR